MPLPADFWLDPVAPPPPPLPAGSLIHCPRCRSLVYIVRRDLHSLDLIRSDALRHRHGALCAPLERLGCDECGADWTGIGSDGYGIIRSGPPRPA